MCINVHLKLSQCCNFICFMEVRVNPLGSFLFSSAGTKRVHNNIIYNEYISDRQHIHMNATRWETLTDFTKWLGREGGRLETDKGSSRCVFHLKPVCP